MKQTPHPAYDFLVKFAGEIKTSIYTSFVFLNIDVGIVKILFYLMIIDTIMGIIKSSVMGIKFEIKILWFGLLTKMIILLIPMVLALTGKGLKMGDFTLFVDIVIRILLLAEAFSIISSAYVIKTKEEIKNVDIVTMLLGALRKAIIALINTLLKKLNKDAPNAEV